MPRQVRPNRIRIPWLSATRSGIRESRKEKTCAHVSASSPRHSTQSRTPPNVVTARAKYAAERTALTPAIALGVEGPAVAISADSGLKYASFFKDLLESEGEPTQ